MIMWKFKSLVGRCEDMGISGVTYEEIYKATGVSTSTLTGIARNRVVRADLNTIDRLLSFFSDKLGEELTINDLLEWKRDNKRAYN